MKKLMTILVAGIMLLGANQLFAQEQQEPEQPQAQSIGVMALKVAGDQEDSDGLGQTMVIETTEDLGNGQATAMRFVTSPDSDMAFVGENGMFFGAGSDTFSMLSNPSVRKDLELVDEQMDRIREVNKDFGQRIRDSLGDLSKDGFDPGHAANLKQIIADIQQQKQEEIDKLLLPHQVERLKQVALQMQMKARGTAGALSSDKVAETLGLTEDQMNNLKTRSKELQQEIAEKTKKLQADAKNELIGMLTSEQQQKLKDMMGDEFSANADDWKSDVQQRMNRRVNRVRGGDQ